MPLIRDGRIVDDPWVMVPDDAPLPSAGDVPVIVSLTRLKCEKAALLARGGPLGVRLESSERAEEIAADLEHLSTVALTFPTFRDGRAYSTARILRQHLCFGGEIRAVGNVLRDQFQFMNRCGIDAYQVADAALADAWVEAMAEMSVFYQSAADRHVPVTVRRNVSKAAE